ncbi:MAG: gamma-glutamyltransferase family protein [Candidatus Moduliflexus flocculans]|nr:gamma-glutamyltransferase family protein [Candidatus Moduliflexus flocculans]
MAVLDGRCFLPHPGEAREAPDGRRDLPPAGPRGDAAQARRGRAAGARRPGKTPQGGHLRPPTTASTSGDIAREFVRGHAGTGRPASRTDDLATLEGPDRGAASTTSYKGIDVYKLDRWTQGPAMLQALNILENDRPARRWATTAPRYIHTLYQAMNLAFADRDFYYGDPYFPPEEPVAGLLSKEYAQAARRRRSAGSSNDPDVKPGDPYPFQGEHEPVRGAARRSGAGAGAERRRAGARPGQARGRSTRRFRAGTTSIAGRRRGGLGRVGDAERRLDPRGRSPARTGIGLSQRMQSFVLDAAENPFNVLAPRQAAARRR